MRADRGAHCALRQSPIMTDASHHQLSLIEHIHGAVGFESEPGQGACFHFELPMWQR
jgi:hypothetical protein